MADNDARFGEVMERLFKQFGYIEPMNVPQVSVPNAKDAMIRVANWFFAKLGQEFKWIEPYNEVADWLTDNKGKGLMLYGKCGQGKTVMARYIIPTILMNWNRPYNLVPEFYDMRKANSCMDEVMKSDNKIIILDDVGTEEISVVYGQRRCAFDEIVNDVEQHGKLLILTSNLASAEEIQAKYGERTLDRLLAVTRRVLFDGESMRNK